MGIKKKGTISNTKHVSVVLFSCMMQSGRSDTGNLFRAVPALFMIHVASLSAD